MKPGPKPKPTVTKKLEGNPGKRKLPDNEPQPSKTVKPPPAPRYLCKVGKKKFRYLVKELHAMGLFAKIYGDLLAAYCVEFATWLEAEENIQEHGKLIKAQSGFPMQSPWLAIRNKAFANMLKIAAEFGMSPSSMSRVSVVKPEKEDPMEAFLKRGGKLTAVK